MICIDAEQLQDGLYNIKDGKIYKYKAKGGTVRAYKLENRPQGEWIKRFGSINCSVCKHSNWSDSFEDLVRSFNYCPNCGAKMKQ